jgi:hypothetical protein
LCWLPASGKTEERKEGRGEASQTPAQIHQKPHNDSGSFRGFRISAALSVSSEEIRRKELFVRVAPTQKVSPCTCRSLADNQHVVPGFLKKPTADLTHEPPLALKHGEE